MYTDNNSSNEDAVWFCGQCGKPLLNGARFCRYCGTPVKGRATPEDRYNQKANIPQPQNNVEAPMPDQRHYTMVWYSILTHFVLLLFVIGQVLAIIIDVLLGIAGPALDAIAEGTGWIFLVDALAYAILFSLTSKARKSLLHFKRNALSRLYWFLFLNPILNFIITFLGAMLDVYSGFAVESVGPVLTVGYLIFCLFNVLYFEHRRDLFVND